MEFYLFTERGFMFLMRWGHFLSGITWIGILYYFNFVQGPFLAGVEEAATKKDNQGDTGKSYEGIDRTLDGQQIKTFEQQQDASEGCVGHEEHGDRVQL